MKPSFGLDPEVFLTTDTGKIISSLPVLRKDKYNPIKLSHGVKMYADNALVELSIPPARNAGGMLMSIAIAFRHMQDYLGSKYRVSMQASHKFLKEELNDKKLWEAGCMPTYDAYTGLPNPAPKFVDGTRTGSFHIHIGHEKLDCVPTKMMFIRLLDIYLGIASVIFDKDTTGVARRQLYGKAGEFRVTPYGVEYRVLGNWALRSPKTTRLAYDLVIFALSVLEDGNMSIMVNNINGAEVKMAINNCDWNMASDMYDRKILLPKPLKTRVFADYGEIEFYKDWKITV